MGGDSKKILAEFFKWFVFFWLLWFFSSGPSHLDRTDKPFLKPPTPLNTNGVFGSVPSLFSISGTDANTKKNIRLEDAKTHSDVKLSFSQDKEQGGEYIEISVLSTNNDPVDITGWKIKGAIDPEERIIDTGVYDFYQGKVNDEKHILIYPGEKALIIPGESPVGVSFKLNKCIGYLEQFQDFSPHLPQNCPQFGLDGNDTEPICGQFIRSIPRCNAYVKDFPLQVSQSCSQLINRRLNYNSCVSEHFTDTDFKTAEWRVYLGGREAFGSENGDIVSIFDAKGNLIDSIFYSK